GAVPLGREIILEAGSDGEFGGGAPVVLSIEVKDMLLGRQIRGVSKRLLINQPEQKISERCLGILLFRLDEGDLIEPVDILQLEVLSTELEVVVAVGPGEIIVELVVCIQR